MRWRFSAFTARAGSSEKSTGSERGDCGVSISEVEMLAKRIQQQLPSVKTGSLRFWGEWLGRPYDNQHRLLRSEATRDVLHLIFNEDESLRIWAPSGLELDSSTFRVSTAGRVPLGVVLLRTTEDSVESLLHGVCQIGHRNHCYIEYRFVHSQAAAKI